MPPQELTALLNRKPSQPFRLVMTDGTTYEVRHPELILVSPRSAHIGYPDPDNPRMASRVDIVALVHVQRLEEVEASQN